MTDQEQTFCGVQIDQVKIYVRGETRVVPNDHRCVIFVDGQKRSVLPRELNVGDLIVVAPEGHPPMKNVQSHWKNGTTFRLMPVLKVQK